MLKQIDKYTLKWPTSIMGRVQSPWKPWKDAITKLKGILARNVTNEKQWGKSLLADLVFICAVENPSWGVRTLSSQSYDWGVVHILYFEAEIQNQMAQNGLTKGSMTSGERLATHGCRRDSSWSTKLKLPCSKATAFLGSAALHLTTYCWLYADQGSVAGSL